MKTEFKSKLSLIAEKQQKLQEEYKAALLERKHKIGVLAERCKTLEYSDAFFAGLFLEAAKKIEEDKMFIKNLEALGSSFLHTKRDNTKNTENTENTKKQSAIQNVT